MDKTFCDQCKRQIIKAEEASYTLELFNEMTELTEEKIDLCPECRKKLKIIK